MLMTTLTSLSPRLSWLDNTDLIRPYVYTRPENRVSAPGQFHHLDWFPYQPIFKNPLEMSEVHFADQILHLESMAFDKTDMAMPRWVFYDCAIVPGFVAGFAYRTS